VKESHDEQRYCPLCDKRETRSECSYGEKAWDKVSVRDHEYSMARSELSTVISAVKRLQKKMGKGEGNVEAWVQSKITKAADYLDTAADYVASGEMEEACWVGYKQEGLKKKGKRMVPNCVPTNEAKTLGFEIKKSSGAGALTPDAAKQLGDKAVALQKKKAASVALPKLKEHRGIVADILNDIEEASKSGDSSLHDWFAKSRSSDGKPGWVQLGGKYAGKPCAKQPGQTTKPKCGSSKMSAEMSPEEEDSAARRKRREDPNPDRKGKAINVATEEYVEEDACKTKVKSRYKVWPSAYASGALVKCRKVGAANWGNKSEEVEISLVEKILGEEKCGKGMYWCNTNKECKPLPKGFDVPGQKIKPTEVGIGKPVEGSCSKTKKGKDCPVHGMDECPMSVDEACWTGYKKKGMKTMFGKKYPNCVKVENVEIEESVRIPAKTGNIISVMFNWRGKTYGTKIFFPQIGIPTRKDVEYEIQKIYPDCRILTFKVSEFVPGQPLIYVNKSMNEENEILEVAAWQRKEGKNPEGGLNSSGVASYRKENPGSKLQTAVTTEPSKLKPGSKDANRRKSFCARMGGVDGPMKDEKGRPTRKALALRKWNCN